MSKMHSKVTVLAILICFVALGMASAQESNNEMSSSNKLSSSDQQFLKHLAKDSQGEVQLAQMMESKATDPQVKEFAQRLVHDHTALDNQVKQVMDKHGMSMPEPLTAEQQQLQSKLQGMSGKQLERTFMAAQVKGHEKDVQEVSQKAQAANQMQPSDPDVTELAQEARPVLQEHLQLARKVASQIGASSTASNR